MTPRAKIYATSVTVTGLSILAAALLNWSSPNPRLYLLFLALGLAGSVFKLRLPGMTGTMSLNFMFALIGIADFSFSETLTVACAGALAQSIWNTWQRPKPIQVLFNVSTLAISTALAYRGSHLALQAVGAESVPVLLVLAATLMLVTNTGLVSGILALTESHALPRVWRDCYLMAFPYFAFGTVIAGVVCFTNHSLGWTSSLLVLPAAVLAHVYYRLHLRHWFVSVRVEAPRN